MGTFVLLGCLLAPGQPPVPAMSASRLRSPEWSVAPRLERGQELVYRGSFRERAGSAGVRFDRAYRVGTRLLVLDATGAGYVLAALTAVQDRAADAKEAGAVRLERMRLDALGKKAGASLLLPIDGPPTLETAFVGLPSANVGRGRSWLTPEPGRPDVAWNVEGSEALQGRPCVKLSAVQQSAEWERPRADRRAWRRLEAVWIDPRAGLPVRIVRTIEQREPARSHTSQISTLTLELAINVRHPAHLADSLHQEIGRALEFRALAVALAPNPTRNSRQLLALKRRMASYLDGTPATEYRSAVVAVKRQVDAACRGEAVTVGYLDPPKEEAGPRIAKVGSAAPEFLTTQIAGKGTARLSRWKGKPVVMFFYHPSSATAPEMLRFGQAIHSSLGKQTAVLGLSVSDDAAAVLKQRTAHKIGFPLLHGGGLRHSYAVEATPKVLVLDAEGVVRGAWLGWGRDTAAEVMAELRKWLPRR